MGCASSTEATVNHATGEVKHKKKLGGAYPGQRRPQHASYVPPASQFQGGTATAHFKAFGGGNALVLVKQDGTAYPEKGKPQPMLVEVTLPDGVKAGQTIHVQAPNGQLNAIQVPDGYGPGSTFTVEFAPPNETKPPEEAPSYSSPYSSSNNGETPTGPRPNVGYDDNSVDDFATGFGNPNSRPPPPTAPATALPPYVASSTTEPDIDFGSYPTSQATPVYSDPPQYPSATTSYSGKKY